MSRSLFSGLPGLHASGCLQWAVWMTALLGTAMAVAQPVGSTKQQPDLSGFFPTALETTLLPQYCWGQFNPDFRGAGKHEFNVPKVCGERMNHFCPSLVALARAKRDLHKRGYWLQVADGHMAYTLRALKEVPTCPMKGEIERYAIEIKSKRAANR